MNMSGRRNIATGAVLGCSKTSIIKGVRYMIVLGKTLRDKYGWPVVSIINKPFANFMRAICQTNIRKTLNNR